MNQYIVNGNELYNIDLFVLYQTNTIKYISWVPNAELLCFRLEGCTDATALNYNPNATDDDGSCILPGCTNEGYAEYNPDANTDDGSCENLLCTLDVVTLELDDSYGDGWNANSLTINGVDYSLPDSDGDYTTWTNFTVWMDGPVYRCMYRFICV